MGAPCTVSSPQRQDYSRVYVGSRPDRRLRVTVIAPVHACIWLAHAIEHAASKSWIELNLLLTDARTPAPGAVLALDVRLYLALERLRRRGNRGQLALVDLAERARATGIATTRVENDSDLRARLAELPADLILAATAFEVADASATSAEWGCWHIGADLTNHRDAGLAFLAPLLDGDLVTPMTLRLQPRNGTSVVLARSTGATCGGSFGSQRDQALRKVPSLLMRALRDLAGGVTPAPQRQVVQLHFAPTLAPLPHYAGARALWMSSRHTIRWWRHRWNDQEMWFVAIRREPTPLDPAAPTVGAVRCLVAPGKRYWADPFLVADDAGRQLLFVEEYGLRDQRGVISCVELLADGRARRLGIVLDEAFHMSFPQVFRHEGAWYMTVESGAARRVRLFRATGFPLQWEPVADLLTGSVCVDPVLLHHEGRWYLFANISETGGGTSDELFLFSADTLAGPYHPHPCNPIVNDVRRSRSAGPVFVRSGRLIRPAQDCAPAYGVAIVFNEILELTPTTYREEPLARLDAAWMPGSEGCHTYASVPGVEVFDARGIPAPGSGRIPLVDNGSVMADSSSPGPSVSVIMPVYNGQKFLAEALDSALAQTFPHLEVIVVDDGSSDASGALADRYAAEHPGRVRVVHQENQGLPLARNAAIAVARGRYLALLDADDVWLPGHLAACVAVLESDSTIGLVHADVEDIDGEGHVFAGTGHVKQSRWPPGAVADPFRAMLLRHQHVACLTAVFRRSIIERVGGFDVRFNRLGSEDRDMWLRIAEVANLVYLDELHARYRVHGSNMSGNAERMWRAQRALVAKFAERPRGRALRHRALAAVHAEWGHQLAVEKPALPALRAFVSALAQDPFRIDAWKGLVRRILVGRRSPGPRPLP